MYVEVEYSIGRKEFYLRRKPLQNLIMTNLKFYIDRCTRKRRSADKQPGSGFNMMWSAGS
jgi:hypothetical protein